MKRHPDVAAALQISERQLSTLVKEGIIRCYRIGRLVFFDLDEVFEDIKRHGRRHRIRRARFPARKGVA